MVIRLIFAAFGVFALSRLFAPKAMAAPSPNEIPPSEGQIIGTGPEDSPTELDYITQTSPESEVIDFSGFKLQRVNGSHTPIARVAQGSQSGVTWTPASTRSLSQVMQTTDRDPDSQRPATEHLQSEGQRQAWIRNLRAGIWPAFSMLNAWLLFRGITPVFLQGSPPEAWNRGRYEKSSRDLDVLSQGLGIILDPLLFTVDPQTALREGRILLDEAGHWWAISRRDGLIKRERVPIGTTWDEPPTVDSVAFRRSPKWLVLGDAQNILIPPLEMRGAQGTWIFPWESPDVETLRDYNRRDFYDYYEWRR